MGKPQFTKARSLPASVSKIESVRYMREHWINPVLYFEFENLNAADKALLEVVGHDTREDLIPRNSRAEKEHEAELKLILSSNFKGWNVSENFIAEKNLGPFSWEFGYALGTSRPLALKASSECVQFLSRKFRARRRTIRWSWRTPQLRAFGYLALPRPSPGVGHSARPVHSLFPNVWFESQQQWLSIPLYVVV